MSFAYSITLALAGGLMPLVATWLIAASARRPRRRSTRWRYGLIGLPIMFGMRETNQRSLDE